LELAQRVQRVLREQMAARCGGTLAGHARAGDLRPVPADGVPYGAVVVARLGDRDGSRGHAADPNGSGQAGAAHAAPRCAGRSAGQPSRGVSGPRVTGEIVGHRAGNGKAALSSGAPAATVRPAALALLDRAGGNVLLEGFEAEADSRLWITAGKRPQLRDN